MFQIVKKVLRKVHNQDVFLNFPRNFDIKAVTVVSYCDASFANLMNAGSQGAFVTFIADQDGKYSPIAWQSRKIRRVVKSTIAAECLAAVEAAEMTVFIATVFKDIFRSPKSIATKVFCDSKNLVNAVHSSTNLEDKRLVIDVSILRDMLQQHELSEFNWISTEHQVANMLTKQGASGQLLLNIFNNTALRLDLQTGSFV